MLKKDPLGGCVGTYEHDGEEIAYHVEGEGSPVLMTMGLSARGGSYDWRFIFDCLAGTFKVYALDVLGLEDEKPWLSYGTSHYQKLIEGFMTSVVGEKMSIISGPVDAQFALKAAFEHTSLVEKILIVSPDGVRRIVTHDTIGRSAAYRILHIPKIESVMYGNIASKRSMLIFLRKVYGRLEEKKARPLIESRMKQKYPPLPTLSERRFIEYAWSKSLMQAPMRLSKMIRKSKRIVGEMDDFRILRNSRLIVFQRSGELPMRKDALRFCDDAIKFLS
jgi:pimeloyl-ACP methyl ester carboxylesterase